MQWQLQRQRTARAAAEAQVAYSAAQAAAAAQRSGAETAAARGPLENLSLALAERLLSLTRVFPMLLSSVPFSFPLRLSTS